MSRPIPSKPVRPFCEVLEAEFIAGANEYTGLPAPHLAEMAFAGRSNVGKSSLINSLTSRKKLVRTSNTPGCTRAINIFRLALRFPKKTEAGESLQVAEMDLVDLPGYGFALRSKAEKRSWGPLIERFLSERPGLRGIVLIVDARRGPEEDDYELIEYMQSVGKAVVLVATKTDKLSKSEVKPALAAIEQRCGIRPFSYSAETHDGRDALWRAVLRVAHLGG